MTKRTFGVVVGLLAVGALALTGIGVARAWGTSAGFGPSAAHTSTVPYGSGGMMSPAGTYGPGSMVGPHATFGPGSMIGSSGMMGGYGSAHDASNASPTTGNAVTMQNYAFQPANLHVRVGTTVTWTNSDSVPHTVTFGDSSLKSSGLMQRGDRYSYPFTTAGTFTYSCAVHPNMTAQVVVTP